MDEYKTISGKAKASLVEKKSEFIANISFADTEQSAQDFLNSIKSEHKTATHNVYGYLLREGNRTRYSDDGEPSQTAGMPVLEVLKHSGIVDAIIVVTRYFGGTLLGTGGLVRAYTQSAKAAIEAAEIVQVDPVVDISAKIDYSLYEKVARAFTLAGAVIKEPVFGEAVTVNVSMIVGTQEPALNALSEMCKGKPDVKVSDVYYAAIKK